eukprot:4663423-Pleurochrysis_carterae.AAC.1
MVGGGGCSGDGGARVGGGVGGGGRCDGVLRPFRIRGVVVLACAHESGGPRAVAATSLRGRCRRRRNAKARAVRPRCAVVRACERLLLRSVCVAERRAPRASAARLSGSGPASSKVHSGSISPCEACARKRAARAHALASPGARARAHDTPRVLKSAKTAPSQRETRVDCEVHTRDVNEMSGLTPNSRGGTRLFGARTTRASERARVCVRPCAQESRPCAVACPPATGVARWQARVRGAWRQRAQGRAAARARVRHRVGCAEC